MLYFLSSAKKIDQKLYLIIWTWWIPRKRKDFACFSLCFFLSPFSLPLTRSLSVSLSIYLCLEPRDACNPACTFDMCKQSATVRFGSRVSNSNRFKKLKLKPNQTTKPFKSNRYKIKIKLKPNGFRDF